VDNTYCTPYLQQPLLLGADVSVHSMTKYLGGHGDLTAGAAVFADAELAQRVRLYGLKDMTGAVMSAQDAHLVMRGLKTLALRMDRHCQSAQKVAEFIAAHPAAGCGALPRPAQLCRQRQRRLVAHLLERKADERIFSMPPDRRELLQDERSSAADVGHATRIR
jgi:O-acetylhomoserine/O-acetylserine sulfhydrylase-like pyridoxal-dependent enzyme